MSQAIEIGQTLCYRRTTSVLWRDTGRQVVALDGRSGARVQVIGGGGALLWRFLEQPATLMDILDAFTSVGATAPPPDEIVGCLGELAACGLLLVEDQAEVRP